MGKYYCDKNYLKWQKPSFEKNVSAYLATLTFWFGPCPICSHAFKSFCSNLRCEFLGIILSPHEPTFILYYDQYCSQPPGGNWDASASLLVKHHADHLYIKSFILRAFPLAWQQSMMFDNNALLNLIELQKVLTSFLRFIPPQRQDELLLTLCLFQNNNAILGEQILWRVLSVFFVFLCVCVFSLSLSQMHAFRGLGWTVWSWRLVTLKSWRDVLERQHKPVSSSSAAADSSASALERLHLSALPTRGRGKEQSRVRAMARERVPAPLQHLCYRARWAVPYVSCSHGGSRGVVQHHNGAGAGG